MSWPCAGLGLPGPCRVPDSPIFVTAYDQPRPLARYEFSDDDPSRIRGRLHEMFGPQTTVECADSSEPARYRHIRHSSTAFHVDQIDHAGDATLCLEQIRRDAVLWVHAGTVLFRCGDVTDKAAQGEVRLLRAGVGPVSLQSIDSRITVVHLGAAPRDAPPDWLTPRNRAAAGVVKRTIAYVTDVLNSADTAAAEVLAGAMSDLLSAAASAVFPHHVGGEDGGSTADAFPATLRAALAYIEANASRRISLADVAAEAYATPRTVQYLFRRYLDTTPTAYLRRVRLAAARQELLTSHRSATTVTATAARWGFGHTGRFAVLYRQTYGESPHETLAR